MPKDKTTIEHRHNTLTESTKCQPSHRKLKGYLNNHERFFISFLPNQKSDCNQALLDLNLIVSVSDFAIADMINKNKIK